MRNLLILILSLVLLAACDSNYVLDVPTYGNNSIIDETNPLTEESKYSIEGIYEVIEGNGIFGDTVVIKSTKDKFSIFGLKNGIYAILDLGYLESLILFEGYWRESRTSNTGLTRLIIGSDEGGEAVISGDTVLPILIKGTYGYGNELPNNQVAFKLIERLTQKIRNDDFLIVGHRGGGRTSDRLPVSENTTDMIDFSKYLGCNGVEIDVFLTKDNIPVLYHDSKLNIRLIQKGPVYGPIKNYTYNQLETFVTLIKGGKIPKLADVLDHVVNNTDMNFVWLDMKEAEAVTITRQVQKAALERAAQIGRKIKIVMGMPAQDIYDSVAAYKQKYPNDTDFPVLCELDPDMTYDASAAAWAPRWTMGSQADVVREMHNTNNPAQKYIDCFVWTIDVPTYIEQYIEQGHTEPEIRFDGLLTNYPTIVAYYYYVRYND